MARATEEAIWATVHVCGPWETEYGEKQVRVQRCLRCDRLLSRHEDYHVRERELGYAVGAPIAIYTRNGEELMYAISKRPFTKSEVHCAS